MTDDRTTHVDLPLPHVDNLLSEDVERLRAAITGIDAKFAALDTLLASDDINLDTLQELVGAIKGDASNLLAHIGAGGVAHQAATHSSAGFMSAADKEKLDGVSLGILFDTVTIVPTANGQTAFSVAGGYTVGAIQVFMNGVKLAGDDFTAAASPDLTLAFGANTTDTIEVVRFKRALSA